MRVVGPVRRSAAWCLLAPLLCQPAAGAGRSAAVEQAVVPGITVLASLSAGEAHAYSQALEAGEVLDALVEQRGADVALALEDPIGRTVFEASAHDDPWRHERAFWIAALPGRHRLIVRSLSAAAGSYGLTLAPPRSASGVDEQRAAGESAYAQALPLRASDEDAKRESALERLQAALYGFRAAGDRRGEAQALEELGEVQRSFGRFEQTQESARRALTLFEELGDRVSSIWAHKQLALASVQLGDTGVAGEHLEAGLRIARETGDAWAEAALLNARAALDNRLEDVEHALESLEQAIVVARRAGNTDVEWYALNNLGVFYKGVGEYDRALRAYEQALPLLRAKHDEGGEARVNLNIANVRRLLGQPRRALDSYERYLAFARALGSREDEARALANMAPAYLLVGEHERALDASRRAHELWREFGERSGQASALRHVGESLRKLARYEESEAVLEQARTLHRELRDPRSEADTLASLAQVQRDRGELGPALASVQESVRLTELLRSRLTSPELRASFVAVGQERYELLVDLQMQLQARDPGGDHAAAALQASEAARARVLLEALVEARADIRQGIDPALLEQERRLQKELSGVSARLARLQTRQTAEAELAPALAELDDLSGRYQRLLASIRSASPTYAELMQPSPLNVAQIGEQVLDADTLLLEYALGAERSYLFALSPGTLTTYALPGRAEIEARAREVYTLLTARQQRSNAAGAAKADGVRQADERLREQSAALSRVLLGPIAARLRGQWRGKRLAIVASGGLAYLPFGALPQPEGGGLLVAEHEIVGLPSASVLAALRRQLADRPARTRRLAVLADPVFEPRDPRVARAAQARRTAVDGTPRRPRGVLALLRSAAGLGRTGFARLPFSRQEAGAIAALAAPGSVEQAMDFQASRAWIESGRLAGRSIVHFATHGLLNSEHPDLSGLVLSLVDEEATWQDGFLRMVDIYNLRLDAELVVLSACETALGREVRGEGLVGITRGFMYAGAPRVVASLWQVDDQSTAELMRAFYRGLLRERRRPAEALRLAQLEISRQKRWAAPYYWAGFVLQGEWR